MDMDSFLEERGEPGWLRDHRTSLLERFQGTPRPTRRDEEWRYTPLKGFTTDDAPSGFNISIRAPKEVVAIPMEEAIHSHPELLKEHLGASLGDADRFALFAAAAWSGGYMIHVPPGVVPDEPVVVKHSMDSPTASHSLIIAGEGAQVNVCEVFEGDTPLHHGVLEVFAGDNSHVNVATVQRFSGETWDCTYKRGTCARDATLDWAFALLGGRASRLKEDTEYTGPGARGNVRGVYFGSADQHFSVFTNNYHVARNTHADVETKGVLRGKSSSLSRGLISISEDAPSTESYLHDNVLHMSGDAVSNSVPCLEIENNDVQASHGSSTGKIDDEKLYYLMSRGLSRRRAEHLIIEGFFEPVIDSIKAEEIREDVMQLVGRKVEEE